jgi:hypothetical protein
MDVVMKTNALTGKTRLQEADFDEGRRVVRVLPRSDQIRRYIKHPKTRVGFPAEGSAEWPNDTFTKRRVRDGDVTIEAVEAGPQAQEQKALEHKTSAKAANKSE